MKRIVPALLCIAIGAGITLGAGQLGTSLAHADTVTALGSSGSATSTAPTPAAASSSSGSASHVAITPADPIANPAAYLSNLEQAKKDGWGVLVLVIVFGIVELLAAAGKWKSVKWLAALGKGRISVVIGAAASILSTAIAAASGGTPWLAVGAAVVSSILLYFHPAGTDPAKA